MKKLILVFATIAITAGAHAQIDSANRNMNPRDMNHEHNQRMQTNPIDTSHPDGVLMHNGKVMQVKNGKMIILDHDMTMTNGSRIMSDGTYIKKDGTKVMLKEGQHMDMSGNLTSMKKDKDKNMYLVPDSIRHKDF